MILKTVLAHIFAKKITWDYRVIQEDEGFRIGEVYYENGVPTSWADAQPGTGESFDSYRDLQHVLDSMQRALGRPLLVCVDGKLVEPYEPESDG